jgi:hypothetical protein
MPPLTTGVACAAASHILAPQGVLPLLPCQACALQSLGGVLRPPRCDRVATFMRVKQRATLSSLGVETASNSFHPSM